MILYGRVKDLIFPHTADGAERIRWQARLTLHFYRGVKLNRFYMSLKSKLIFLCLMVMSGVILLIHMATYMTTRAEIENRLVISAGGVATALAHHITMNCEPYIEFIETRDTDSEYYRTMQEYFRNVKRYGGITYIYTERRLDADTVEYIIDAEEIDSENYSFPGTLDTNEPRKEQVYTTGNADSYRFSEGNLWGDLVVSYAPIYDRDGNIIGLLGVDIDIRDAYSQLTRIQGILIATYSVIIILVMIVLIRYSNTFLDSILKDKLTGAFNKRFLDKLLRDEIKMARRNNRRDMAVMMMDLDHFKSINDTYGHEFGDKVLKTVSKTVQAVLRRDDCFIRYGGEEFVVIISGAMVNHVSDIAERIRNEVEDLEIANQALSKCIGITISIGVGGMDVRKTSPSALIEQSDKALYMAKKDRNKVVVTAPA